MTQGDQLFARFGKECSAGTVLFREDEPGETMYVIQSGRVRISKEANGVPKTLAVLGPGEFLGEMAILNEKPRTATAEVVEDARLLVIDARTFESMVVSNAEIAVRLIKRLARRLDHANQLVGILTRQDPKARVILGLSHEAEVLGEQQTDGSVLVPHDAASLGRQLGLTEEEVQSVLRRLVRLGLVEERGEGLLLTDMMRLHEFLEFLQMRHQAGDA